MKTSFVAAILFFATFSVIGSPVKRPWSEKAVSLKSFKGRVALTELGDGHIEIRIRTWRTTRDTVRGQSLYPLIASGQKQPFYCGHFGSSRLPMLIFAISDPDRTGESRCVAYQIAPNGSLIGQQVIVDEAKMHSHSDNVTSGRYQLTALDPTLGAIYTIAYQEAHFEGFFVSYEKLRLRQWDPTINAFIESDQGFLRDQKGRLVQAARYQQWPEREREHIFAANVGSLPHYARRNNNPAIVPPVSAQK